MTDTELNHLVKMANQIADNLRRNDSEEAAAARITDHMTRFWAPSMKVKIIDYLKTDGTDLKDVTKLAVAELDLARN